VSTITAATIRRTMPNTPAMTWVENKTAIAIAIAIRATLSIVPIFFFILYLFLVFLFSMISPVKSSVLYSLLVEYKGRSQNLFGKGIYGFAQQLSG
jgi:hypothetical protein